MLLWKIFSFLLNGHHENKKKLRKNCLFEDMDNMLNADCRLLITHHIYLTQFKVFKVPTLIFSSMLAPAQINFSSKETLMLESCKTCHQLIQLIYLSTTVFACIHIQLIKVFSYFSFIFAVFVYICMSYFFDLSRKRHKEQ